MPSCVSVLGPLPPPFGGVSVHIVRYIELLRAAGIEAKGYSYTGTTSRSKWGKFRQASAMMLGLYMNVRCGHDDVLHLHYGGMGYFLAAAPVIWRARGRKVITFHSMSAVHDQKESPAWMRRAAISLLNRFDLFVCVRSGIGDELRKLGLSGPDITIMPAFLPPATSELNLERLSENCRAQLQAGLDAGRMQVCCAAYYLGSGYGKRDLYGVSELAAALALADPTLNRQIDVWVLVSNRPTTQEATDEAAKVLQAAEGMSNAKLHLLYGVPLIPIMARSSGFLRPSREDGDSVAIREALSLGLPVLASDVVERPDGVETFSMNGAQNLATRLGDWLASLPVVPPVTGVTVSAQDQQRYQNFVEEVVRSGVQASAR